GGRARRTHKHARPARARLASRARVATGAAMRAVGAEVDARADTRRLSHRTRTDAADAARAADADDGAGAAVVVVRVGVDARRADLTGGAGRTAGAAVGRITREDRTARAAHDLASATAHRHVHRDGNVHAHGHIHAHRHVHAYGDIHPDRHVVDHRDVHAHR